MESPDRVFFVHVMKTGGSNLIWHVKDWLPEEAVFPNMKDYRFVDGKLQARHHLSISNLIGLPEERRRQIRFYASHYPFVAAELIDPDLVTVAILRHPVARTISLVRALGRPGVWADRTKLAPMASRPLEEVYDHPDHYEPLIHNHQTKIFSMTPDDPLDTFRDVIEIDEARLEIAKRNLERVDVLGVNERYDVFLEDVEARFGWRIPPEARVNQGRADDDRVASEAFLQRIAEENAFDIALHEHAMQLVAARHAR